jgi:hypothetical protein
MFFTSQRFTLTQIIHYQMDKWPHCPWTFKAETDVCFRFSNNSVSLTLIVPSKSFVSVWCFDVIQFWCNDGLSLCSTFTLTWPLQIQTSRELCSAMFPDCCTWVRLKREWAHWWACICTICLNIKELPYILESNPHPFYSFRGLKIRCGLESVLIRFAI